MYRVIFKIISLQLIVCVATKYTHANTYNLPPHQFKFSTQQPSLDLTNTAQHFFWHATTKVNDGYQLAYENTIYTKNNWFSLNLGSSISSWNTNQSSLQIYSVYLTPVIWLIQTNFFSFFIHASAGGPSAMNNRIHEKKQLSVTFMFQDYIGVGAKFGNKTSVIIALNFYHYSNLHIFTPNAGFDVPGVISFSVCF